MKQLKQIGNDFLNLVFAPKEESERQDFGFMAWFFGVVPIVFFVLFLYVKYFI